MKRPGLVLLMGGAAAALLAVVVVLCSDTFAPTKRAQAVGGVEAGVICTDQYLDVPPLNAKGSAPGVEDWLTGKALQRIEPLQGGGAGDWLVIEAAYAGPNLDGDPIGIPDKGPTAQSCQPKIADAGSGVEANKMNPLTPFVGQYDDERGAEAIEVTSSFDYSVGEDGKVAGTCLNGIDDNGDTVFDQGDPDCFVAGDALVWTTCVEAEDDSQAWTRTDYNIDAKETGGKRYGQVVVFTDAASPTVPGDPTTCDTSGAVLYQNAFPTVLVSSDRDPTTDKPADPKNGAIAADPSPPGSDSADGLADDWDGDGCTDWDELSKTFGSGADPLNPYDCDLNYSSGVEMLISVVEANKAGPGAYFYCRGDSQHDKGTNEVEARVRCIIDNPGIAINPKSPSGDTGDGFLGTTPDLLPPYAGVYLGSTHTVLTGDIIKTGGSPLVGESTSTGVDLTNADGPHAIISGCFNEVQGVLGPAVYVEAVFSINNGAGYADMWIGQAEVDCKSGTPVGPPTFDKAELTVVEQLSKNVGPNAGDWNPDEPDAPVGLPVKTGYYEGCTVKDELGDDPVLGGLRDPYNPNDMFDTNGDGKVDLPNDILGVVLHWTPGGAQYEERFDRGTTVTGSYNWIRNDPDGIIDLPNDILGVVLQWQHQCSGGGPPPPPPAEDSEMVLNVKNGNCDDADHPTVCYVPGGASFILSVDAATPPSSGYILAQTFIDYGTSLTYTKGTLCEDELIWPDLDSSICLRDQPGVGLVAHAGLTALLPPQPKSNHVGNIVSLEMTCPVAGSVTNVELLRYGDPVAGTSGALFTESDGVTQNLPEVSPLTIECVPPQETVTQTIGVSGGDMTTGSGDMVETTLDVPSGALPDDTEITISAFNSADLALPSSGEGVFLSRGFLFLPQGLTFSEPATSVITYDESEVAGIDESTIDIAVFSDGEWSFAEVLDRDTVANTITISVPHFTQRQLCPDCDGDGCINEDEDPNPDPLTGGLRDPFHRWDYYDVASDGGAAPDKKVSLVGDVLRVLRKYQQRPEYTTTVVGQHNAGATVLEVADETALNPGQNGIYSADLIVVDPGGPNEETVQVFDPSGTITSDSISLVAPTTKKHADGEVVQAYIESFDRGDPIGPNGWERDEPDGVISLANDILGVIAQWQHDCS